MLAIPLPVRFWLLLDDAIPITAVSISPISPIGFLTTVC